MAKKKEIEFFPLWEAYVQCEKYHIPMLIIEAINYEDAKEKTLAKLKLWWFTNVTVHGDGESLGECCKKITIIGPLDESESIVGEL